MGDGIPEETGELGLLDKVTRKVVSLFVKPPLRTTAMNRNARSNDVNKKTVALVVLVGGLHGSPHIWASFAPALAQSFENRVLPLNNVRSTES
jgi:hypothetical protein